MDVMNVLNQIFNNDQLAEITKTAKASEGDVTSVLSSALPLVAGQTTQRGFDLGSLASLAGGNTGSILTALLGSPGTQTVSQQSGISQSLTNSILSVAAPMLLSSLTGSNGSGILSLLGGLAGGASTAEAADTIQTVIGAPASQPASGSGKKKKGLLAFLSSLFGGKK